MLCRYFSCVYKQTDTCDKCTKMFGRRLCMLKTSAAPLDTLTFVKKKGLECEEQFVRYGAVQFLIETD